MAEVKTPKCATIDYETHGIEGRPNYPPEPVGVSIRKLGSKKIRYFAWGHPTENNCTFEEARNAVLEVYDSKAPILHQNGKFDYDVARTFMGAPKVDWSRLHDTMFQIFLHNPHASTYSLKPSAETILGMTPEERDVVKDWVLANIDCPPKEWGAHIWRAPGGLVGAYADGDVIRTDALHEYLYPTLVARGMVASYDREREVMPILLENEMEGVRVDFALMEYEQAMYAAVLEFCDQWLRVRLKTPDLNIDADKDFADALERCGVVTQFNYTAPTKNHPNGQRSVSKKNLTLDMFEDREVASVYGYRNRLATCLRMFIDKWIEVARATGGKIHTNWNQVRQSRGDSKEFAGARTGRLSSNPNFQNIPKDFEGKTDGWTHPAFLSRQKIKFCVGAQKYTVQFPQLPLMRKYLLPDDKDHVWGHRDYSQQELRILAHYEDGDLLKAYLEDPKHDVHGVIDQAIRDLAKLEFPRGRVKQFVFQKLYGGGFPALTEALGVDIATTTRVIKAMEAALPGYKALETLVRNTGRAGLAIRTWGGREYYTEPASFSKKHKRQMTYEYKLLNYLIQGSAADCTKQALIYYNNHPKRQARFLVTVHDEINVSMPRGRIKEEMAILNECMLAVKFDLPMLSEGKVGENWGSLTKFQETL